MRGKIEDFARGLFQGTPLGRAGYQPFQDTNLGATLKSIQGRFATVGSAGGGGGGALLTFVGRFSWILSVRQGQGGGQDLGFVAQREADAHGTPVHGDEPAGGGESHRPPAYCAIVAKNPVSRYTFLSSGQ